MGPLMLSTTSVLRSAQENLKQLTLTLPDSITCKIRSWGLRHLSLAGRAALIKGLFRAALAAGESLFQPPELFFNCLGQLLNNSFSEIWSCFAALQKSLPPPSFSFRKIAFSLTGFGNLMISSVGTCSEAGRPSSDDSEPWTAFLRRFRAPGDLSPAIPSALLHRTPKHSAAFQNCSPEIYFKTALSEQQLFNPPELSQTEP
ncbi:hypothetical protein KSP39_PZI014002 [Platanthera zijinensis]|uniref:Uncharacterized protein n=1 Tax=Platanthera zijinensis TaxID=2320716 RepID=A0AAP0BDZ2_9ASPA